MAIIHDDGRAWTDETRLSPVMRHRNNSANRTDRFLKCVGVEHIAWAARPFAAIGLLLCLCIGCSSMDLRGQPDPPSELSELTRQARPKDPNLEPFTFSNRARSIESDLGVR
ncbi:MAG: hypothetical protein GYA33_10265 [Thermogutta sp.]|nr:hypothetical protein [Thermogutta sp.]